MTGQKEPRGFVLEASPGSDSEEMPQFKNKIFASVDRRKTLVLQDTECPAPIC